MGFASIVGILPAVVAAVIVGLVYNVPEFEDFKGPVYLGIKETAEFKSLGNGLYKTEIFWHMTPFHHEVGGFHTICLELEHLD